MKARLLLCVPPKHAEETRSSHELSPHSAEKRRFSAGQKGEFHLCSPLQMVDMGKPQAAQPPNIPLAQHGYFYRAHIALGAAVRPAGHCQLTLPLCLCGSGVPLVFDSEKCCHSVFPFALPALVEYWNYTPNHHHPASPLPSWETSLLLETAFKTRFGTNNLIMPADALPQHCAESTPETIFLSSAHSCKEKGHFYLIP